MNAAESHVVEWSDSKHSFRIRSLAEVLKENIREFFGESVREYAPLGLFSSVEDAARFVEARKRREASVHPEQMRN